MRAQGLRDSEMFCHRARAARIWKGVTASGVYLHDTPAALRYEIRGELTAPAAESLRRSVDTALSILGRRVLLLDLTRAHGLDEGAREVLRELAARGAQFVAAGEQAGELGRSLQRSPRPAPAPAISGWRAHLCRLASWLRLRCACLACEAPRLWVL